MDIVGYLFGIIRVTPALGTFRTEVGARLVSVGRGREVGFAVNAHTNSNASTSGTSQHGVREILAVTASKWLTLTTLEPPGVLEATLRSTVGAVLSGQAVVLVVMVVQGASA